MSFWTRETTADIGLRVFSNNLANLFKETASLSKVFTFKAVVLIVKTRIPQFLNWC